MTDPTRMSRSDETPDELRALLSHAERPSPLTAEDRAKILAGAAAIVAGSTVTTVAAAATTTAVRASMLTSGFFVKVVGLAAVVVTVGLGARALGRRPAQSVASSTSARAQPSAPPAVLLRQTAPEHAPTTQPTRAPTLTVAPSPVTLATPMTAPARSAAARSAPTRVTEPAAEPARRETACPVEQRAVGLAHESRVLATATAALASDPATAAACVRLLDRVTTSDALRDELLFVGYDAARRLGRDADARRYAEALVARSPASNYAARARRWLEQR